jgi:TetR/AcrR family transcriptional regulator, regulator of cefoperazone and chloramphenicol sensitivity
MRLTSDTSATHPETRARLLEAAGESFAEHGFRNATVRQICQKAEANVAAVHYHFGDKEELYTAVLKHTMKTAMENHPLPTVEGTPEEQLHRHVRATLRRIFDEGRPSWHGKLMAREMAEPTRALDSLVNQIRINQQRLSDIVRQLLGPGTDEETVLRYTFSVSGQCLFYWHCRAIVCRLHPGHRSDAATIEELAEHITKFSLAALKEYRS